MSGHSQASDFRTFTAAILAWVSMGSRTLTDRNATGLQCGLSEQVKRPASRTEAGEPVGCDCPPLGRVDDRLDVKGDVVRLNAFVLADDDA